MTDTLRETALSDALAAVCEQIDSANPERVMGSPGYWTWFASRLMEDMPGEEELAFLIRTAKEREEGREEASLRRAWEL